MSLPTRQQRVLDRIEHSLRACEPHLGSMFAIFTRLTRDEVMPRREELPSRPSPFHGWRTWPARPRRRRPTAAGARAGPGQATGLGAIMLVTITLLAVAPAVLLGLGTHGVSGCGPAIRPRHTAPALSQRTICPPWPQLFVHQQPVRG